MEKQIVNNKIIPISRKKIKDLLIRDLEHFTDELHYLALNKTTESYNEIAQSKANTILAIFYMSVLINQRNIKNKEVH